MLPGAAGAAGRHRNRLDIVRLKDKLGNRSNASSELEFAGTWAQRLGDEGRGVRTIIEMVAATRLDCVLGSASLMRRALAEASWHVAHRSAFGSVLADKPLMQNVDRRPGRGVRGRDHAGGAAGAAVDRLSDPHEAALRRIALPLAKFWVCKRTPMMTAEALECLGGNGYVEESVMPLIYRESPLNSVWEGSGTSTRSTCCGAVARAGDRDGVDRGGRAGPGGGRAARPGDPVDARDAGRHRGGREPGPPAGRTDGRCLQGSLLVRFAPPEVADAFCGSRLGGEYGGALGPLPPPPPICADRHPHHPGGRLIRSNPSPPRTSRSKERSEPLDPMHASTSERSFERDVALETARVDAAWYDEGPGSPQDAGTAKRVGPPSSRIGTCSIPRCPSRWRTHWRPAWTVAMSGTQYTHVLGRTYLSPTVRLTESHRAKAALTLHPPGAVLPPRQRWRDC